MKLYHHTNIGRTHPLNITEWNEELGDHVWKRIYWLLITRDIDMNVDGGDRFVFETYYTDFPDPDPNNFIPFVEVGDRDILRWIRETESTSSMVDKERTGLVNLINKYGYIWNENI